MTPQTAREIYVSSVQTSWQCLVHAALSCEDDSVIDRLAEATQANRAVLRRKVQAIRFAASGARRTIHEIVTQGQSATLSFYAAHHRQNAEKQRFIRWRVPATLAEAIQSKNASPDQEESLQARLVRVLGIQTSEELWDFILSAFADLSDKELMNLAGVERTKKNGTNHR